MLLKIIIFFLVLHIIWPERWRRTRAMITSHIVRPPTARGRPAPHSYPHRRGLINMFFSYIYQQPDWFWRAYKTRREFARKTFLSCE